MGPFSEAINVTTREDRELWFSYYRPLATVIHAAVQVGPCFFIFATVEVGSGFVFDLSVWQRDNSKCQGRIVTNFFGRVLCMTGHARI